MILHLYSTGCTSNPSWIEDGYCDDGTNNQECHFDGGDCCGYNINIHYCTECICFEDVSCSAPLLLIGDGICDDEANTAGCTYDGGDCCGDCINTDFCTACICHQGGEQAIDLKCKHDGVSFQ